jgi:HEAT repeat protein
MRKRVHIVLAVLLVMLAGVAAWQGLREREPVYQGKSLSKWLEDYTALRGAFTLGGATVGFVGAGGGMQGYRFDSAKVDAAVRQIGTNALPTLLRMLRVKDSALRLKLERFARQHTGFRVEFTPDGTLNVHNVHRVIDLSLTSSEALRFRAVAAFRALGGEARRAVPELIEIYKQMPERGPWGAGAALGSIGPDASAAIPSLLRNVGNTNAVAREIAVTALGEIHAQPQLVVPALIAALHDPAQSVELAALAALGRYGEEAKTAVPALVAILKAERNPITLANAAAVLGRIHADPEVVVPALIAALHHPVQKVRIECLCALREFGAEAKPAVPALLEFLKSQADATDKTVAASALKAIDPAAAVKPGVR